MCRTHGGRRAFLISWRFDARLDARLALGRKPLTLWHATGTATRTLARPRALLAPGVGALLTLSPDGRERSVIFDSCRVRASIPLPRVARANPRLRSLRSGAGVSILARLV